MRLQKPKESSKTHVIVWDPREQTWSRAQDSNLAWFALRVAKVERDIKHGYDYNPGICDETMRLPLDFARTSLVNLHNVLACARRKIEGINKK